MNKEEIAIVLQQFEIGPVTSSKLLDGGYENTNYLVKSESIKYILCICEQKSEQEAEELARLLIYLGEQKFNTSKVIPGANGELVIIWKDKPVMIRTFIEGDVIEDLSPHLLKLIGKEVAKLHNINAPEYLPKQLNYGKEQFANIKKYAANSEFDRWLEMVLEYIAPYFALNLPKSLIHSDVFWDNVIINEDENSASIMDFEESTYYYRVFDIGMTIIGTCADGEIINLEKARHLLNGYQSQSPLTTDEINSLKAFTIYAGASMTYWRHQNFNYLKPDPKMYKHYLGLKVLVDYVFELDDDCFIIQV
ncbi:MAG: homoserine kinase [Bacteroidetes bacterium]|nr:homoserine kinase [Bacteroidota bacterium]